MSTRPMSRTTAGDYLGPIRYSYAMSPHVASHPYRMDEVPRKRPKYTRSKTGCLTCRAKKVKCDEAKPVCTRCAHGQRECTWPNPRQAGKASDASDAADGRSSTTSSSPPVSEPPTPPIRTSTSPLRRQTTIASPAVPRQPRRASIESALPSSSTTASASPTAVSVQGRASQAISGPRSSERLVADYGESLSSYSMTGYSHYMQPPSSAMYSLSSGTSTNEGMPYASSSHLAPYYGLPHVDMPPNLGRSPLAAPWEGGFDAAVQDAVATKPYDLYHPVPVHAGRRFAINPYSPSDYQY
ncbi:hypothetical protein HDZ31DRAFT_64657 [Schizophyllum fasciatum]